MQQQATETDAALVKERDLLRFTTAGSVDDGKSTLIGRMLYDSKQIFQDQIEQLENASKLRGEENVDLALLTDGLRAEREQSITIDVAYRYFSTAKRKFIIADTPGHEQYTRNMVTGASTADLAVFLVDARNGVITQSKRHGIIASLLGIPHMVVCINKMDLVDYSRERYEEIVEDYKSFAQKLNVHDIQFIPVSALMGDNVVDRSDKTPWYEGPPLLQFLENVTISADRNLVDFRFPVQYVVRPHQDFRGFAGNVVSGTIRLGEEIIALPSMQESSVKTINFDEDYLEEAGPGDAVILTLKDEIDISRGDMIVRRHNIPQVDNEFEATLCWMDERYDLSTSTRYILQHTTQTTEVFVEEIAYRLDVNTLHRAPAESLALNELGRVKITTARQLFFDPYDRNRWTGGFIMIDPNDFRTVAAGMIRHTSQSTIEEIKQSRRARRHDEHPPADEIQWDPGLVALHDRVHRQGHKPLCVWLTGISGAGKSAVAHQVEKELFDNGFQVVRLDRENLAGGLNRDLEFSRRDQKEAIQRAGYLARLLYDYGNIVLCTFVSQYKADREFVRTLFPAGDFLEVHVDASLSEAERRDPRGLYERAQQGELLGVPGKDEPYEPPERPEVYLDTETEDAVVSAENLLATIKIRLNDESRS
ncbi:MAG: sulfate adenylyltransferase subunit CysN [Verrucomicrobiota bacterium]